jgi:hypothetical protein
MDNVMEIIMKRLFLLFGCSVLIAILLGYEFSRGFFSPRGLGIVLLILCIAIGVGVVLIAKSARPLMVPFAPSGPAIDPGTRKLLMRAVRRAKIRIAMMGALLVLAVVLPEIRNAPIAGLLAGLAINLLITATSIRTVVRLQKVLS